VYNHQHKPHEITGKINILTLQHSINILKPRLINVTSFSCS